MAVNFDSDTISRQAAIETVMECYDNDELFEVYEDKLRELPPAQPERIIYCKDCKYGILDCDFPHERYCDFKGNEWNNDNHYCGHAKRREVTT